MFARERTNKIMQPSHPTNHSLFALDPRTKVNPNQALTLHYNQTPANTLPNSLTHALIRIMMAPPSPTVR